MRMSLFRILFVVSLILLIAGTVHAEEIELRPLLIEGDSIADIIDNILAKLIQVAIPLAIIMFVASGVVMISSSGDKEKVGLAKRMFTYTVVGLAIVLIGKGFITLLKSILAIRG